MIGAEIRGQLSATIANVMLSAADAVEAACPVQTGHLLSNFILSTGAPHHGVVGSPEAVSYSAQDKGRAKVLEYDIGKDGKIFYSNNVHYLRFLPPFVTQALMTGVQAAPRGRKTAARSMLKSLAKLSFRRGK